MQPLEVIIWICVAVFALSAGAAVLHLLGVLRLPREYGRLLVRLLVAEIIVAGVGAFAAELARPGARRLERSNLETPDPCDDPNPPVECIGKKEGVH